MCRTPPPKWVKDPYSDKFFCCGPEANPVLSLPLSPLSRHGCELSHGAIPYCDLTTLPLSQQNYVRNLHDLLVQSTAPDTTKLKAVS